MARWLNSWAMTASSWALSASASSSPWRLMAAIASSALTLLCCPRTACSTTELDDRWVCISRDAVNLGRTDDLGVAQAMCHTTPLNDVHGDAEP